MAAGFSRQGQYYIGMSILVGNVIGKLELDAVGRHFKTYVIKGCVWMLVAPLWCGLGCCSRTAVVIKAAAKTRLSTCCSQEEPTASPLQDRTIGKRRHVVRVTTTFSLCGGTTASLRP